MPPEYYNNHHLYVGGEFSQAGLKTSKNFAVWGAAHSGSVKENNPIAQSLTISPNPAQTSSTIKFSLSERVNISISIIDPLGRTMKSLGSGWREAGANEIRFDVNTLPDGIYFCQLKFGGQSVSAPFIVVR